ncbi:MAG: hypothetical protein O7D91_13335 [Planctomycetota bacterium]|nr:hypothetical protein [Planctomycetota bacterium]
MHYTEPGIRVVTVFFAALVGFGLKHLADVTECSAPDIYPHRAICFVLGVLLFLRFLLGSANHLSYEHGQAGKEVDTWNLGFDLAGLTGFGIIAVSICYAGTLAQFLQWSVYFLAAACVWMVLDAVFFGDNQARWWPGWLIIDLVQISFLQLVICRMTEMGELCFGYARWKVILLPVYFLCLAADFAFQMHVLKPKER